LSSIRWVRKEGIHVRSEVLREFGLSDKMTEQAALEMFRFHCDGIGHLVNRSADSSEARNYYYNSTPFDEMRTGTVDAAEYQWSLFAELDARGR